MKQLFGILYSQAGKNFIKESSLTHSRVVRHSAFVILKAAQIIKHKLLFDTISWLNSLIKKSAVPAAFSAENAENTSLTEPLRALWRYENL